MIDIHSHLFADIDDGSKTLEESLALAQYAVDNGITHSVITPHIHEGRYQNTAQSIEKSYYELKNALIENSIPLEISYAAEVRVGIEIMDMVENNMIPFLGQDENFRYILLEMPHSHVLPGIENLIEWLLDKAIKPVIAHPERNKELQRNYQTSENFIDMGCLFQLTAASISGNFGNACLKTSHHFLEQGWVSFVATDAHNLVHRPPDLMQSKPALIDILGIQQAENLLLHNAWKITKDKFG